MAAEDLLRSAKIFKDRHTKTKKSESMVTMAHFGPPKITADAMNPSPKAARRGLNLRPDGHSAWASDWLHEEE